MNGENDKTPSKRGSSGDNDEHVLYLERLYPFSARERPYYRVFMILISLFLLLGFAGLFGDGTLSNGTASNPIYEMEYQRFLRVHFPAEIVLRLKQVEPSEVDVTLNSDYLQKVEIMHVTPYPKEVRVTDNHIIYTIQTEGAGPVIFYISPRRAGHQPLEVVVNNHVTTVNQFIYF